MVSSTQQLSQGKTIAPRPSAPEPTASDARSPGDPMFINRFILTLRTPGVRKVWAAEKVTENLHIGPPMCVFVLFWR